MASRRRLGFLESHGAGIPTETGIRRMRRNGVELMRTWITPYGRGITERSDSIIGSGASTIVGLSANEVPEDPKGFYRYVENVAEHYNRAYGFWIFNEKNTRGEEPDPDHYAMVVRTSIDIVRTVAPEAKIVAGDFRGRALAENDWIDRVASTGLFDNFDVVTFHAIGSRQTAQEAIDTVGAAVDKLKAVGVVKPVWVTELGFTSKFGTTWQAEQITKAFPEVLKLVDKAFYAMHMDLPLPGYAFNKHGLLDANAKPKPDTYAAWLDL